MCMYVRRVPWRGVVGAMALTILMSACAQGGSADGKTAVAQPVGRTASALPSASNAASATSAPPASCRLPKTLTAGAATTALTGPVLTALTGGPVTRPFRIDDGGLIVDEPRPGDSPGISALVAACIALASISADGVRFGDLALSGGVRIGLARVTVAGSVAADSDRVTVGDGEVQPSVGTVPPYHDRLAWVLAVRYEMAVPCPMIPPASGAPKATDPLPSRRSTDFDYQVFLVDAHSGADALTYTEGRPALCGGPGRLAPSVSVPVDGVSVAWSMTARNPDGHSATITADMLTCDGYEPLLLPDADRPAVVQVLVQRPIGRACGAPVRRPLTLHAAEVTALLPAKLVHAPTGLFVPLPDPAVQSSPPH
jgi:hypothetical protein